MKYIFLILISFSFNLLSQENFPQPTPSSIRYEGYIKKLQMMKESLVKNIPVESIGPTIMSGRSVDIDVSPQDPTHFYVAYASGGLWKTTNNGISFEPLFDNQIVMTIGDIAVDWDHGEIIWVGSGESNSSRSSYSGFGIFKSTDKGKTWHNKGLTETHHIGRILIHPENPNILWVAAVGHLYSPNEERGVFKTTDGGETWKQVLYIDENTGAIDLEIDPQNPQIIYAVMWYRTRRAWNFEEAGPTSGIYKSTDGGETWFKLNTINSGFPTGNGVGRIGLSIYKNNPQVIYAILDNQFKRDTKKEIETKLTKEKLRKISVDEFLKLDNELIDQFLDEYDFPQKYNAKIIRKLIRENKITPQSLVDYIEDANAQLFDVPVVGAEVYKSTNGGTTWIKTHSDNIDDFFYSYGYYFGQIRVSPYDENKIFILGVPILVSNDGGKTFKSLNKENVHVDHHSLWLNPNRPGHIILSNDGGINISYDDGETWFKANTPPVGQFYSVEIDFETPYNIYGGLQDNGVWFGPSNYKFSYGWYASGEYPYKNLLGGDGMQVEVDTRDNKTIYAGFQFGNYFRIDKVTRKRVKIKPQHELGERPPRFNWNTPIQLSKHNQDILYIAAQKVYRSMNKGEAYEQISPDLTKGVKIGDVPYGTITTLCESPLKFGLIYTGSDDGLVYVTKDGGNTWQKISDELPQNFWVSRVIASKFDTATVYVALNGYRWDNFEPLIYKSTNYGLNWERIGLNLPYEPVNVIIEDPIKDNILYVGTDNGVYVSLDKGNEFMPFVNGFPQAPVHDLVVHPRENELIIATHGRSLFKTDVKLIQQLTEEILAKSIHLFKPSTINFNPNWGNKTYTWGNFVEPNFQISVYSKDNCQIKFKVLSKDNHIVHETELNLDKGLNFIKYDLTTDSITFQKLKSQVQELKLPDIALKKKLNEKFYLLPGNYTLLIEKGREKFTESFEIKFQKKPSRSEVKHDKEKDSRLR